MKEQFHGKMLEETFQERVENMVAKKINHSQEIN